MCVCVYDLVLFTWCEIFSKFFFLNYHFKFFKFFLLILFHAMCLVLHRRNGTEKNTLSLLLRIRKRKKDARKATNQ